jgi:hypothetical protein
MEQGKPLMDCAPEGDDFQRWVMRTHLRIHPELVRVVMKQSAKNALWYGTNLCEDVMGEILSYL